MARPREFDIDEAVDRAMDVFWTHGYEGSSLARLLRAMKIARGSLYKAFNDKRRIYLAALDRYDRTVLQIDIDRLRDPSAGSGSERIRRFLQSVVESAAAGKPRRGCLLANAAVDRAPFDVDVAARVRTMIARVEQSVVAALQDDADLADAPSGEFAQKMKARLLANTYLGLHVLAKAGYPPEDLEMIVNGSWQAFAVRTPGTPSAPPTI